MPRTSIACWRTRSCRSGTTATRAACRRAGWTGCERRWAHSLWEFSTTRMLAQYVEQMYLPDGRAKLEEGQRGRGSSVTSQRVQQKARLKPSLRVDRRRGGIVVAHREPDQAVAHGHAGTRGDGRDERAVALATAPLDHADALQAGRALTLRETGDGDRLVVEPDDPGAQAAGSRAARPAHLARRSTWSAPMPKIWRSRSSCVGSERGWTASMRMSGSRCGTTEAWPTHMTVSVTTCTQPCCARGRHQGRTAHRGVTEQERRPGAIGAHAALVPRAASRPRIRAPARHRRVGAVGSVPWATHEGHAKLVVVADSAAFPRGQRPPGAAGWPPAPRRVGGSISGPRLRAVAPSRAAGPARRGVARSLPRCASRQQHARGTT